MGGRCGFTSTGGIGFIYRGTEGVDRSLGLGGRRRKEPTRKDETDRRLPFPFPALGSIARET